MNFIDNRLLKLTSISPLTCKTRWQTLKDVIFLLTITSIKNMLLARLQKRLYLQYTCSVEAGCKVLCCAASASQYCLH